MDGATSAGSADVFHKTSFVSSKDLASLLPVFLLLCHVALSSTSRWSVTRRECWDDLGYSFLIGGDGRVYVSRGWDRSGAHTKGHNDDALAAAFIGDFSRHLPTPWAGKIRPDYTLHGHRDANCRTCPGEALYAYISRWRRFGGKLKKYICETPVTQSSSTERVSTQTRIASTPLP
ncbi:hypothetical protein HPB49_011245 [Dermacentor silvarum]|uniref:Uncharacterized protein n=1 Tax=Dermacentor silvarum TaxID=543639 RepID=A0ACB8CKN6_DERSI|nr:hypothetical protein HPB49_011245 [Dermacentor silvarum]